MGGSTNIVARSRAMRRVIRELQEVARLDQVSVHIAGETGTGKELAARWLHFESVRARASFVAINCAALPDALLEAELFGHTRGAFTGALHARRGLLAEAHRGTLFLDEVAELSPRAQSTLLRVLQEKEFRRLGDSASERSDFRIVSASHKDLEAEVAAGRFRQDLMFRLKVVKIEVPPLRERPGDIIPLVAHVLKRKARELGLDVPSLSRDVENVLTSYAWPGNVRELENEIVQALVRSQGAGAFGTEHLSAHLRGRVDARWRGASREFEKKFLKESLERYDGNRARTARALGLSRQGLYRKLKRLGIESEGSTIQRR